MSKENDDDSVDIIEDNYTEDVEDVVQETSSLDEVKKGHIPNASRFVSQREIISLSVKQILMRLEYDLI